MERKHGVFQDRLVKELRLRNISDMDQANALLDSGFLDATQEAWCEHYGENATI